MSELSGTKFIVDPVEVKQKLFTLSNQEVAWDELLPTNCYKIEACSNEPIIPSEGAMNAFIMTVHTAYDNHCPLVLSPDHIWLVIAQGFVHHITQNAERFRSRFVDFEGKKKLIVRIDDFVKGDATNPWTLVFPQFSAQIREFIGDENHKLMLCNYSTTGVLEKAVSEIVLMDTMRNYFSYGCITACGIPTIRLTGTLDDWMKIRQKLDSLETFDLAWWTTSLKLIIDEFIQAYQGHSNQNFWRNFFKYSEPGSGMPEISGWINSLFPYLSAEGTMGRNHFVKYDPANKSRSAGPAPDEFPPSYSSVSFDWNYDGHEFHMAFFGGFCGSTQDSETFELKPALGWVVAEKLSFFD